MSLLQMSLSGSLIILTIVLLRSVALHRLPKTAFLLLWGLALLRLLLPYSLPSALSVFSLWERLNAKPEAPLPVSAAQGFFVTAGMENTPAAPAAPSVDPWRCAYFVGAAVCAIFFLAAYCKCRMEFRTSLPLESEIIARWRAANAPRRLSVRQSDRVAAPLTYGLLRPVILLPKAIDLTDEESLCYVLAHELTHIRRLDALSKLLLTAAVCLHWFNPLVWVMYVLANRDLEISCDEAVVRSSGGAGAAYAMTLIRMEEHKLGLAPFSSGFSRNAIEERIVAIMKLKKSSALAVLTAALLVAGTGAAFATTAAQPMPELETTVLETVALKDIITQKDPDTGEMRYSDDGGKTYMTRAEFDARYPRPEVEWWTYADYKAWLEKEKPALQAMLGERGWTGGRGDFVWTQEIIDETIAMYEQTLENIKNGYLVSKSVNGSEDTMLAMGTENIAGFDELRTGNALPLMEEFEPFGLSLDTQENALYYKGEKVRYFEDSVDLSDGAIATSCSYYRRDGSVSLRAVRESARNADGSTNPFGPLLRLEKLTAAEEAEKIKTAKGFDDLGAVTYVLKQSTADDVTSVQKGKPIADLFDKYKPYGISYEEKETANGTERSLYFNGRFVNQFSDQNPAGGVFTFGSSVPRADGIKVCTVYKNGILSGVEVV